MMQSGSTGVQDGAKDLKMGRIWDLETRRCIYSDQSFPRLKLTPVSRPTPTPFTTKWLKKK